MSQAKIKEDARRAEKARSDKRFWFWFRLTALLIPLIYLLAGYRRSLREPIPFRERQEILRQEIQMKKRLNEQIENEQKAKFGE